MLSVRCARRASQLSACQCAIAHDHDTLTRLAVANMVNISAGCFVVVAIRERARGPFAGCHNRLNELNSPGKSTRLTATTTTQTTTLIRRGQIQIIFSPLNPSSRLRLAAQISQAVNERQRMAKDELNEDNTGAKPN